MNNCEHELTLREIGSNVDLTLVECSKYGKQNLFG